jgi:hypothetical protein
MTIGLRTRLLGTVLLIAATSALSGCDTLRSALGSDKQAPDEFAVVTKAPLIMPPDYNLKPPKPGAPPTNQVSPTQSAQAALFNADPATVAAAIPGSMSMGEKLLLSYAGAANSDPSIRQVIAAENKKMQSADDSFTDSLMFWQKPAAQADQPVDADAEAKKQAAQKADPTIQKDTGTDNAH